MRQFTWALISTLVAGAAPAHAQWSAAPRLAASTLPVPASQVLTVRGDGPSANAPAVWGSPAPVGLQTRRIHLLIAADTSDQSIGKGVEIDVQNIIEIFQQCVPDPRQLNRKTISGKELTRENIFRSIAELQPAPADAIVCVFSGHGDHNATGHYLCMAAGGHAYRSDIITAMRQKGARMVALLSSACNTHKDTGVDHVGADNVPGRPTPFAIAAEVAPLFDELFLKPYGAVDINSCSEGQIGGSHSQRGSSFLRPLIDYFRENRDQRLTWNDVVSELNPRIVKELKEHGLPQGSEQKAHTIRVWSLPRERHGSRFGVVATDNSGNGVRVVEVWSGYPGARVRDVDKGQMFCLEPHDVILAANGVKIHCMEHFFNAVTGAPENLDLTVRDARTGQVTRMSATLTTPHLVAHVGGLTPGVAATEYVFPVARIRQLRQEAERVRELPASVPEGWSKSPVDPAELTKVFPCLGVKAGLVLRAYVYNQTALGCGQVCAVPGDAAFPEPGSLRHFPPKPPQSLGHVMGGITGTGSPWSYLCASILSRELAEFGARWHGCRWTTHTLLGANPLESDAAGGAVLPAGTPSWYAKGELPRKGDAGWRWLGPRPAQWQPTVQMGRGVVTVVFHTYSPLDQEGIYQHVDTYVPGSYLRQSRTVKIAAGARQVVF